MDLQTLVKQWLTDNHPDVFVDRTIACLPINSPLFEKSPKDHVWYVFRIDSDRVYFFNPARDKFGADLVAGLPTFFEKIDAVIKFYRSYDP